MATNIQRMQGRPPVYKRDANNNLRETCFDRVLVLFPLMEGSEKPRTSKSPSTICGALGNPKNVGALLLGEPGKNRSLTSSAASGSTWQTDPALREPPGSHRGIVGTYIRECHLGSKSLKHGTTTNSAYFSFPSVSQASRLPIERICCIVARVSSVLNEIFPSAFSQRTIDW